MTKDPIIIRVSGPLVVAKNCFGAKMYDVVAVSDKRLIGEIIELREDTAFIQVYEETSGIGPGEPVYLSGQPLSVELGPGLVGSIYDGIQRPLNLIREKSGDFIGRGISLPGLDRQKRWHFQPLLKSGDVVETGDILGQIPETSLLMHKILVPKNVQGKIIEIKEGDYRVEDIVAKIETEKGIIQIKSLQTWPVRKSRAVKEKFAPNEILTTGQRVIDTLFPIAKGGTACIPGPFGSGKCVSGDTPVILGNGKIVLMCEIFEEAKVKGKLLKKDCYEEIYDISGLNNPTTISYNQSTFAITEPIAVYKGKTDSIVVIKTRTGKIIEVTPIHKLFVLEDGKLIQEEARNINVGDYIASPRKIKLNLLDQSINILNLLSDKKIFCCDENINQQAKRYIKHLIDSRLLYRTYRKYLRKKRRLTLDILKEISIKLPAVNLIPGKICSYHGKEITIPKKINPQMSEFLGYIIADGNLKKSSFSIRFYNSSQELLDRFVKLSKDIFSITPYIYHHPKGNTYIAQIDCKALWDLLVTLGIPHIQKAKNASVPECILKSSDNSIASFIGAYIACDGSLDKKGRRIKIYSASRKILIQISYLLLRLGIISTLYKGRKDKTFRLAINSIADLEENLKRINIVGKKKLLKCDFINKKSWFQDAIKVPGCFKNLLLTKGALGYLQKQGIYVASYCYRNEQRISVDMVLKIIEELSKIIQIPDEVNNFVGLLKEIFFDIVIEKKILTKPKEVYDIQVPLYQNFIGGSGALILHNTVVLHEFARWSDAEVIIYVAAGERGNEVCDLLLTLPELKDPRSGRPLLERTVVIANTSNMPVAAREASVYTGITIAEYFRDMGYSVALMADSTSRWAEALREISGRLEEMPGEEGYPAYLSSRIAEFYERAGKVVCLGKDSRSGALSVMGAVSPPGGDLSDPVVQATLRVVKVFWGLDDKLANARHFPAINWLISYSLYHDNVGEYLKNISPEFIPLKREAMRILEEESSLLEIARLVGVESLSNEDRLTLETAKSIREDFLHQNAFHDIDTYTSLNKQYLMLKMILDLHKATLSLIKTGRPLLDLLKLPIRGKVAKCKYILETKLDEFKEIIKEIEELRA